MESFLARQPIFDARQNVYGYELLFRSGLENVCRAQDLDQASSKVLADTTLDLDTITGGKKAFINATREVLLKEYITLLPRDRTVIEVLETVEPDAEVIAACEKLKKAGWQLALDDFVYTQAMEPLLRLADFVKVDILQTSKEQRQTLARQLPPRGIRLVAEKVETLEEQQEAADLGFSYFQGYYFSRPVILARREVPAFKLHYLQLLEQIQRPTLEFGDVEDILRKEVSLVYKLLRYINSAFFGLRNRIESIHQALVLLGERDIRKWTSLMAMASMASDKPEELVVQAAIRAKYCESLASQVGLTNRAEELFLLGMLSLIDAILDCELPDVLKSLPIADDVAAALLGEEGRLRDVYEFARAHERGDWESLADLGTRLNLDEAHAPPLFYEAVKWGEQAFRAFAGDMAPDEEAGTS